jgi:hypothetical protein
MNVKKQSSSLKLWFFLLWSMMAFVTLSAAILKFYKMKRLDDKMRSYKQKITALEQRQKDLMIDIQNKDDPIWIELALMEELGVIPEGAIKITYLEDP